MTVRRLPKKHLIHSAENCANGCLARYGTHMKATGYRQATHVMLICGRATFLCGECAREAERVWAGALGPSSWERAKSRPVAVAGRREATG